MAIKKPVDGEDSSSDDELQMAALHATRSKAHHDLETGRARTRSRGYGPSGADGTNTAEADPEKTA